MNMIEKAREFAKFAHRNQVRKYTEIPYIVHPIAVSTLLELTIPKDVTLYNETIAAGLLHDVVEDTDITFDDIFLEFGSVVMDIVSYCTNIAVKEDGNRRQRFEKNLQHYISGSYESKSIKIADMIDNCQSIVAFDPKFAKTYLEEKTLLLDALKNNANRKLINYATITLKHANKSLELYRK